MTALQLRALKGWETRRARGEARTPEAARAYRAFYMTAFRKRLLRRRKCRSCCRRRDRLDRIECQRCRRKSCARAARHLHVHGRKAAA